MQVHEILSAFDLGIISKEEARSALGVKPIDTRRNSNEEEDSVQSEGSGPTCSVSESGTRG